MPSTLHKLVATIHLPYEHDERRMHAHTQTLQVHSPCGPRTCRSCAAAQPGRLSLGSALLHPLQLSRLLSLHLQTAPHAAAAAAAAACTDAEGDAPAVTRHCQRCCSPPAAAAAGAAAAPAPAGTAAAAAAAAAAGASAAAGPAAAAAAGSAPGCSC
jgi:hypothetical protein